LEEIEQREQERNENAIGIMTPLLEYMKKKREDKKAALREVSLDLGRHRSWVCHLWDWVNLTHELVKWI